MKKIYLTRIATILFAAGLLAIPAKINLSFRQSCNLQQAWAQSPTATSASMDDEGTIDIDNLSPSSVPQRLDYFTFGLGFLISLLAVLIPFSFVSELWNVIQGQFGALGNRLARTMGAKELSTVYHRMKARSAQTRLGQWWLKQKARTDAHYEAASGAYQAVFEDIKNKEMGNIRSIELMRAFRQHRGKEHPFIDRGISNYIKNAIGKPLAKVAEEKAQAMQYAPVEIDLNKVEKFFKGELTNGKDVLDVMTALATLRLQAGNYNNPHRQQAEALLEQMAERLDVSPDQLKTADLSTGELGRPILRAGEKIAFQPALKPQIDKMQKGIREGSFSLETNDIQKLAQAIGDQMQRALQDTKTLTQELIRQISTLTTDRRLSTPAAIEQLQNTLDTALERLREGKNLEAVSLLRSAGISAHETMSPRELEEKINGARAFLTYYRSNPASAQIQLENRIKNEVAINETTQIVNHALHQAGHTINLNPQQVYAIYRGDLSSIRSLEPNQQEVIRKTVQEIINREEVRNKLPDQTLRPPSSGQSAPNQSTPNNAPSSRNEYYAQLDTAREQRGFGPPQIR